MSSASRRAAVAAALLILFASRTAAQESDATPLEVVVTANRLPTSIQRTGSAVTVVTRAELERSNPGSLVDALRSVPGLDITETGGPGASTAIRLRGANAGQTLVLVDGVRVNDPGGAAGEFDPAIIAPGLIDRIEVLRGPQSALYGSDAIGGVINIITKKGRGRPTYSIAIEGGSYGTLSAVGSMAGAAGPWSYAFSLSGARADGFSRYGYRIGRLQGANNVDGIPGGGLEADGYSRIGGFGRLGYDPGNGFRFDIGVIAVDTQQQYDAANTRAVPLATAFPDTPAFATRRFTQVSANAELDALDGLLTHKLQLFANRTDRTFRDVSLGRVGGVLRQTSRTLTDFIGDRVGAEYQATLRLQQFGSLIAGARLERETADSFSQAVAPTPGFKTRTLAAEQDTQSAFALWQWPASERLTLSLGGRYDKVSDAGAFPTLRTTVAYRIPETGSKLRASAGTGAKAPTLFQRFSPQFGTPDLSPERSFGVDAGIDQDLFEGRVVLSATVFANRFRNLINFVSGQPCPPSQTGCYVNVQRASTSGVEVSARAILIENGLTVTGAYTYLQAKDSITNLTLARRPQHSGRLAFQITPTAQWLIEPSITMLSARFSGNNETNRLAPYARLDIYTEYRFDQTWKSYARIENITNARYQEVYNYGTTGRAFYAGLSATW
jgi:vitamin B12 transporter